MKLSSQTHAKIYSAFLLCLHSTLLPHFTMNGLNVELENLHYLEFSGVNFCEVCNYKYSLGRYCLKLKTINKILFNKISFQISIQILCCDNVDMFLYVTLLLV